jgi:hypothetical protein
MRKLGEQWVEEIDGKPHMVKAVKQTNKCSGCVFCTSIWCSDHNQSERDFDCMTMIIKDLGVLNEDGCLPCPFCKEYPDLIEESDENDEAIYTVEHECSVLIEVGWWHDRQQAIDAWNRRV